MRKYRKCKRKYWPEWYRRMSPSSRRDMKRTLRGQMRKSKKCSKWVSFEEVWRKVEEKTG